MIDEFLDVTLIQRAPALIEVHWRGLQSTSGRPERWSPPGTIARALAASTPDPV